MSRSPGQHRHLLRGVLAALVLVLPVVALQPGPAAGATTPVRIQVDLVSSPVEAPGGTPGTAVPHVLVAAGQTFSVDVSFYDADGFPAAFAKDTTLTLTTNTAADNAPAPDPSWTVPAGAETATLFTSLPLPANQVEVTVSAPGPKGKRTVEPGVSSALFDVLKEFKFVDDTEGNTALVSGIGGLSDCTEATPAQPVCGTVVLPLGAVSSQIMLSLGLCDRGYAACDARGSVVQLLADLDTDAGDLYTPTAPATLIIRCDKDLCGGGAIKRKRLSYSLEGNAALTPAPDCPAKNTIGTVPGQEQEVCIDYTQSTRDGSGDTILYLLFTTDARISVS